MIEYVDSHNDQFQSATRHVQFPIVKFQFGRRKTKTRQARE